MTEERAHYGDFPPAQIRSTALLPYEDENYTPPTCDEFRAAMKLARLTGAAAGTLLGVQGRGIRRWIGGEREIPYAAWRLLLIETRLVLPRGEYRIG